MDCKYSVPPGSPEPFCKYTHGERLFDTTDPDEEQHAPFKKRARVRIFPGNNCRLLFRNLPKGKSNFTCNIKLADSATSSKTSVVEMSKLLVLMVLVYLSCAHPALFHHLSKRSSSWTCVICVWLQGSSSRAQGGVSYYKAAVAYCWPWWHFPCYWKFTGCEQGAKLLHTLTVSPVVMGDHCEALLKLCVCTKCTELKWVRYICGMSQACELCIMHSIVSTRTTTFTLYSTVLSHINSYWNALEICWIRVDFWQTFNWVTSKMHECD